MNKSSRLWKILSYLLHIFTFPLSEDQLITTMFVMVSRFLTMRDCGETSSSANIKMFVLIGLLITGGTACSASVFYSGGLQSFARVPYYACAVMAKPCSRALAGHSVSLGSRCVFPGSIRVGHCRVLYVSHCNNFPSSVVDTGLRQEACTTIMASSRAPTPPLANCIFTVALGYCLTTTHGPDQALLSFSFAQGG